MHNLLPQITFVYDRYHKASASRKAAIEIRVTYQRKQKYLSTGIKIYPSQWRKGEITGCDEALQLNQLLSNTVLDIRQVIIEMLRNGHVDIQLIPERLKQKTAASTNFLEFCKQRSVIRKYGKKPDSQKRYDRFLRLFEGWGGIREFEDITDENIISYDKYLKKQGLKTYSKWNNYHRFLNSFIMDAISAGRLHRNPYNWVKIERDKASKGIEKYLTPEEFRKIRDASLISESLQKTRDVFVFQTYTCLSYADLKKFDSRKLSQVKGMKVYCSGRSKTEKGFIIPMLQPALDILDKYNGVLPIISNVNYNIHLKELAKVAGIDKPISSHWARHTGATLLLNEGVDMRIVSKICGHSSMRITEQVYAKLLDETVVDAISEVNI